MLRGDKAAPKRRGATNTTREAQPFDPAAYAALIAMAAAEKRLRESHSRGASASTARPSSEHRPPYEPSPDSHPAEDTFVRPIPDQQRVDAIVARYRPRAQSTHRVDSVAVAAPRTLLEQLALESQSSSSVASRASDSIAAEERTVSVEKGVGTAAAAAVRTASSPVSAPSDAVSQHRHHRASTSASSSPPAIDPALVDGVEVHDEAGEGESGLVSLRDASPLREQSVVGAAGISYRVSTVDFVHTVAQQLNFALYQ